MLLLYFYLDRTRQGSICFAVSVPHILIFEFVEEAEMGTLGALTCIVMCINLTLVALSKKLVGKGAFEM
mgnify:CR=1 FL=1